MKPDANEARSAPKPKPVKVRTIDVVKAWRVCEGVEADTLSTNYNASVAEPDKVAKVMAFLTDKVREEFWAVILNGKGRIVGISQISVGTTSTALVHPREFYLLAVREGAVSMIAVHNHPSGDPEPSVEDLAITRRLRDAGEILGIPLLDHVIVAESGFTSMRERMGFR